MLTNVCTIPTTNIFGTSLPNIYFIVIVTQWSSILDNFDKYQFLFGAKPLANYFVPNINHSK